MNIPEFNYLYDYDDKKWLAYSWIPDRFEWDVFFDRTKSTVGESLIITIKLEEFTAAATLAGRPPVEAEQLGVEAMRFLLTTPRYARFLKGCECLFWSTSTKHDNSNNLNYIESSLCGLGIGLRDSKTVINELDVIGHFFGIAPIPEEKIFCLL